MTSSTKISIFCYSGCRRDFDIPYKILSLYGFSATPMKKHVLSFFPALIILLAACAQVQPITPSDRPCAAVQEGV